MDQNDRIFDSISRWLEELDHLNENERAAIYKLTKTTLSYSCGWSKEDIPQSVYDSILSKVIDKLDI